MKQLDDNLAIHLESLSQLTAERKKLDKRSKELKEEAKAIEALLIQEMGRAKTAKLAGFILELKTRFRKEFIMPETSWIELKVN